MKYYIKQRVFSFGDKYDIFDEYQSPVFHVQGQIFSLGAKLRLYDLNDKELYFIKRRLFTFLPKYEIYKNDSLVASAFKHFTFFTSKITVESDLGNFEINGEFMAHDFSIYKDGNLVASFHKKWLTWGDTYEIEIEDKDNISFYIALVITIDNCIHDNKSHGGHSSSHR